MKKILLGLIATLVVLFMATTNVNAASISVSPAKAEVKNTVTVTYEVSNASNEIQFDLAYDATNLTYNGVYNLGGLDGIVNKLSDGNLRLVASDYNNSGKTTKTVSITFTVNENAKVGEMAPFTVSNPRGTDKSLEGETTQSVEIVAPIQGDEGAGSGSSEQGSSSGQGDSIEQGGSSEQENSNEQDSKTEGNFVDENGKKITHLPQTGAPVGAIAVAILVVAGIVLIIKK